MPTYGYIRTSRDQEPGHPGSDPHVQRRQLVEAGVEHAKIYADVAASGAKDYNSRDQWHVLDELLAHGDVLVVAAIDRLGRRYLETMWAIYDLQRRGVRLRSLADNEVQWTKYLDADPDQWPSNPAPGQIHRDQRPTVLFPLHSPLIQLAISIPLGGFGLSDRHGRFAYVEVEFDLLQFDADILGNLIHFYGYISFFAQFLQQSSLQWQQQF